MPGGGGAPSIGLGGSIAGSIIGKALIGGVESTRGGIVPESARPGASDGMGRLGLEVEARGSATALGVDGGCIGMWGLEGGPAP